MSSDKFKPRVAWQGVIGSTMGSKLWELWIQETLYNISSTYSRWMYSKCTESIIMTVESPKWIWKIPFMSRIFVHSYNLQPYNVEIPSSPIRFSSLRNASLLNHLQLVHEVWMSIMEARIQWPIECPANWWSSPRFVSEGPGIEDPRTFWLTTSKVWLKKLERFSFTGPSLTFHLSNVLFVTSPMRNPMQHHTPPLDHSSKGELTVCGDATQQSNSRKDVLPEAHNTRATFPER